NRLLAPQLPGGRFVTMASVLVDPTTGETVTARAGHPPCIVISGSGNAPAVIAPDGFPLGFLEDSTYGCQSLVLHPGDALVMVTDGITEACNRSNKMFGNEGVIRAAQRSIGGPAREMVAAILTELSQFCDGRIMKDDVTLLVLKRRT
ncbi:MAG: serine/threonine-protein phosphatase, partial [Proteobacteria bacterium]|nr:serine/threonine-protein phosphatase [Pseudomonadota bacterium]